MVKVRRLKPGDDDLAEVAAQLNAADSEVSSKTFTKESLEAFIADPNRIYLIATIDGQLAGALHGYINLHPAGPTYIYVDEVDTVKQYRRRGVATALMGEIQSKARTAGFDEVWLGVDEHNDYAEKFYDSLSPTEIEPGKIYSWKLK